ncbi:ATP-binding protein [Taibaiella koreensis]|uniref:ATP-binding protein n=1 Tax=Taibaiella koreensis TaxID=1268548 RepID=UPI000E59ED8A|nr:tetratricopeptide repeat-containing sensor histidine kinase [Taibaiella koreensis]
MKRCVLFIVLSGCFFLMQRAVRAQPLSVMDCLEIGNIHSGKSIAQIDTLIRNGNRLRAQYPDTALGMFTAAFRNSSLLGYADGIAAALLGTGAVYVDQKASPGKGLAYFRKAYPFCLRARKEILLLWYNDIGSAFCNLGILDSAAGYYYSGLAMARRLGWKDKDYLFRLYSNMGINYYGMGQYDQAIPYLRQARDIVVKDSFAGDLTNTYLTLSGLFVEKDQPDSALCYIKEIEKLLPLRSAALQQQIDCLYGIVYFKRQQPGQAIVYFKRASAYEGGSPANRINSLEGLGAAYTLLKRYQDAAYHMEAGLQFATGKGMAGQEVLSIYSNLSEIYDSLHDYKKAYRYHKAWALLKDSLDRISSTRWMEELKGRYQLAQKNNELQQKQLQLVLNKKALRKKDIWIIGALSSALVLLVVMYQKHRLQQQRAKTVKQKQRIGQLKAVIDGEEREKSRIGRQLHDDIMVELSIVKMGLDALSQNHPGIADTEDYEEVLRQIDNTGMKIRQTAHNLMPDILLHDGLEPAIQYFCNNVAMMTRLRINFQYYGDLAQLSPEIAISIYRMVQELVQNVMKHARADNILIQINYRAHLLSLTVEDDGRGISYENELPGDKMGLKSIRMRVKALQGSIDIHQRIPNGTSINIELKL